MSLPYLYTSDVLLATFGNHNELTRRGFVNKLKCHTC